MPKQFTCKLTEINKKIIISLLFNFKEKKKKKKNV